MLKVDFINVGYGDSILVRILEGNEVTFSMLVDCGDITIGESTGQTNRIKAVEFLKKEGIKTLDLLVISHLHLDHTGGLLDLIAEIGIETMWVNYLPPERYWGKAILNTEGNEISPGAQCLVTSLNIYVQALEMLKKSGTKIVLNDKDNHKVCFGPLEIDISMEEDLLTRQERIWADTLEGRIFDDQLNLLDRFINNASLRMRLRFSGRTVDLPGDIYAAKWEQKKLSNCDIIKIPHHGHKDSMTEKLVNMLQPAYAVISVSNTRTDCPSLRVVELIVSHAGELYFTDAVAADGIEPVYHECVSFSIDNEGKINHHT